MEELSVSAKLQNCSEKNSTYVHFTLNVVQGFRTLEHEEILKSLHRLKLSDSDLSTG